MFHFLQEMIQEVLDQLTSVELLNFRSESIRRRNEIKRVDKKRIHFY